MERQAIPSTTEAEFGPALWPPEETPHYRRFASRDIREIRAYASRVFNPLSLGTPPESSGVSFTHAQAHLHGLSFNFVDYGHSDGYVDVTIPNVGGCFYLQFSLAGTCEITTPAGPVAMGPGSTFVIQSGLPCRLRLYPGYKSLIVRGDQTSLEDALARELGCPLSEPLIFAPTAGTEGDPAGTLASMVALVCKDLNSADSVLAGPVVGRQMEEMILHLLVRSMAHNYSAALQGPSRHSSPACLRRAEVYIAAHAREPIKLDDILRHAGASERTLHAAFRRFRHTTPMAFLRDLRLDLSRGDLLSSGSDGAKVTDVAFGCGFTHLSRFSADYKKRFGELPSATRRAACAQTSRPRRGIAR